MAAPHSLVHAMLPIPRLLRSSSREGWSDDPGEWARTKPWLVAVASTVHRPHPPKHACIPCRIQTTPPSTRIHVSSRGSRVPDRLLHCRRLGEAALTVRSLNFEQRCRRSDAKGTSSDLSAVPRCRVPPERLSLGKSRGAAHRRAAGSASVGNGVLVGEARRHA